MLQVLRTVCAYTDGPVRPDVPDYGNITETTFVMWEKTRKCVTTHKVWLVDWQARTYMLM